MTKPLPWWGRWLALAALMVACAGAGFATGRLNALESVQERVVVVARASTKKAVATKRATTTRTVSRPVLLQVPDGGVLLAAETVTETRDRESSSSTEEHHSERRDEASRVTVSRPDWRVGVLVGATWKEPALRLGDTPLVLGATVERRIIGPFSMGAWGTTQGAAGLSLAGEF